MKVSCSIDEIKRLSPKTLKEILEKDEKGEYLLLDVRQPEEYRAGHIPGAMLIPLGELEARHGELEKNQKIIIYCRSGHRSMGAAILLCGLGFTVVHSMDGGMLNWSYETLTGFPEGKPDLLTGKQDVEDVLKIALRLEKGSQDFYMQVVKKIVSPIAIKVFQRLAIAEEKHMDEIFHRYATIFGQDRLTTFRRLKPDWNTQFLEGGVEISKALFELRAADVRDELEALEVGLENEYFSYDFYKRIAGMMSNVATRTLLHELAWAERRHIDWLLIEINRTVKENSS
ncbi:MAG: hypothetical protein JSV35_07920 [Candidatus Bathyarchaeota archaeon]|nr:MAG: hypothetical protein JSV35_07920 [Candidatus Bathyarchaeota archaeon]